MPILMTQQPMNIMRYDAALVAFQLIVYCVKIGHLSIKLPVGPYSEEYKGICDQITRYIHILCHSSHILPYRLLL